MKAEGALLNTHIRCATGVISDDNLFIKDIVEIRCTSDVNAETLSLTYKNVQISVSVKDIEKLIEETRNDRKDVA